MPSIALAYHSVSTTWRHGLAVTPERFRAHMLRLRTRGYRGVQMADLRTRSPDRRLAVTFDDGFATVLEQAKPILDELGWPATVFVVTDAVDRGEPVTWIATDAAESDRRALSWADTEQLADAGWEVGSHGCTHTLLSSLPDDALAEELTRSRDAIISRIGGCASISYPWGEVDARVTSAAGDCGYVVGSGLAGRFAEDDPLRIPRVAIGSADTTWRFALKTSRSFKSFRSTAGWSALERARRPGRPLGV